MEKRERVCEERRGREKGHVREGEGDRKGVERMVCVEGGR